MLEADVVISLKGQTEETGEDIVEAIVEAIGGGTLKKIEPIQTKAPGHAGNPSFEILVENPSAFRAAGKKSNTCWGADTFYYKHRGTDVLIYIVDSNIKSFNGLETEEGDLPRFQTLPPKASSYPVEIDEAEGSGKFEKKYEIENDGAEGDLKAKPI